MSDSEEEYNSSSDSDSDNEMPSVVKGAAKKIKAPIVSKMAYDDDEEDDDEEDDDDDDSDDDDYDKKDIDNKIVGIQIHDEDEDEDEEEEEEEEDDDDLDDDEKPAKKAKKSVNIAAVQNLPPLLFGEDGEEDQEQQEDDDEDDENYLQKFDIDVNRNYINEFHPECVSHNYDEISKMSNVIRDENGIIVDPFHKTIPFLTKYERARVLGQRAKQIETGSKPLVKIPDNIIDGYLIADMELEQKKIPFIIRRPLPNGGSEYWRLSDLEVIAF
jgi:DNA-directed RNA polymerase subunit K/omega